MSSFRIRQATASDAEALAVVGAATFLDGFADLIPGTDLVSHCNTHHSASAYAGYLASEDARTAAWLAEHGETGAPIGYALTCPPDLPIPTGHRDIELKRIYLLSRAHGGGAAQALMDAALAHAAHYGAPRMLLGTYDGNARAIGFYARNGFSHAGTRQFCVGEQVFDDIIMSRAMSPR